MTNGQTPTLHLVPVTLPLAEVFGTGERSTARYTLQETDPDGKVFNRHTLWLSKLDNYPPAVTVVLPVAR